MANGAETLADFVAGLAAEVKEIRKRGVAAEIVPAATAAADQIEARTGPPAPTNAPEQRAALIGLKTLLYNAAADCWPGWETGGAKIAHADLLGAQNLAASCTALVAGLDLGPRQMGNGIWLSAAFDLALGRLAAAAEGFARAAAWHEQANAPDLAVLCRGYVAIAGLAGGGAAEASFQDSLTALSDGAFKDGEFLRDQLLTARQIFAPTA